MKGGFPLVHCLKRDTVMLEKVWQCEMVGHIKPTVSEQREVNTDSQLSFF